jgi:hypothetical protein
MLLVWRDNLDVIGIRDVGGMALPAVASWYSSFLPITYYTVI